MAKKFEIKNFGSVCSGIEAASYVLEPLGIKSEWFSEIALFPSKFLSIKYPHTPNVGDMNEIPAKITNEEIVAPDFVCGGTPCQAFSLAGWKNGLNDDRGQLTLKYIDILNQCDKIRSSQGKDKTIFFWENVEGVLSDRTNAFGCFIAGLAGLTEPLPARRWSSGGVIYGKDRNIAWRILDSKYFGVPQQRKRIYVIGGGTDFHPQNILFEMGDMFDDPFIKKEPSLFDDGSLNFVLTSNKGENKYEVFRSYSDCLYTAYGTKWNGNAAAFNGSLFVSQNDRIRRLTPIECERLMGFPDNYTNIGNCSLTQRYQAIGNSWAIPVIQWIFKRLVSYDRQKEIALPESANMAVGGCQLFLLNGFVPTKLGEYINASAMPYGYRISSMIDFVDECLEANLFLSAKACDGILRRKDKLHARINSRLEMLMKASVNY